VRFIDFEKVVAPNQKILMTLIRLPEETVEVDSFWDVLCSFIPYADDACLEVHFYILFHQQIKLTTHSDFVIN
jgi:hypothetical protein